MKVKELIEILFYAFNPDVLRRKMLFIALKNYKPQNIT